MAESARLSQLVGGRTQGLEAFGVALRQALKVHGDLGSEPAWQALGQLVAEHWEALCREQPALSTWTMLVRTSEAITRVRRAQTQDRGSSAADALAEFRAFMGEIVSGEAPPA